jgi:hypothetical protein
MTWTRAQQADRMRRVAALVNLAGDDVEGQARVAAFRQALQQLGWTEGRNLHLEIADCSNATAMGTLAGRTSASGSFPRDRQPQRAIPAAQSSAPDQPDAANG